MPTAFKFRTMNIVRSVNIGATGRRRRKERTGNSRPSAPLHHRRSRSDHPGEPEISDLPRSRPAYLQSKRRGCSRVLGLSAPESRRDVLRIDNPVATEIHSEVELTTQSRRWCVHPKRGGCARNGANPPTPSFRVERRKDGAGVRDPARLLASRTFITHTHKQYPQTREIAGIVRVYLVIN